MNTYRLLQVEGTAHERGFAQGQAFRGRQSEVFAALASLPAFPDWMPASMRRGLIRAATRVFGSYYLKRHRPALTDRDGGELLAQLRGLESGFGMSAAELYGLNSFEIESCNLPFSMGCTSIGVNTEQAKDGAACLAYNHDFVPAFEPFIFLRRSIPSCGYRSLEVSYALLVGLLCGVNEHGLSVSVNQAYATDIVRSRAAVMVSMMAQECLQHCRDVGEAVDRLRRSPASNGAMVTLVDEAGDCATVELTATSSAERREQQGRLHYTFNKYRVAEMDQHEAPIGAVTTGIAAGYDIHQCNLTRERRFLELTASQTSPIDDDALATLLSDHDGGPGDMDSICRHQDPYGETTLTAIINTAERTIRASFGHACTQARTPQIYDLDGSRDIACAAE